MSEYFVGKSAGAEDPMEPPLPGEPGEPGAGAPGSTPGTAPEVPLAPGASAKVRFGIPFNGVVPIWHDGTAMTWHRPLDGTDLAQVLGLGLLTSIPGPSPVPEGWEERVDVGTLTRAAEEGEARHAGDPTASAIDAPFTLRLTAAEPTGRRAINDPGDGAAIPLGPSLPITEAMGATAADFDITGFSVHIARLMLRAARDRAILLFTLRAPNDPEAHHLLSAPSEVESGPDGEQMMHFHLGTLLEMDAPSWEGAEHSNGMALLDVTTAYSSLLAGRAGESLDVERLIAMAQPVTDAILQPGFPFALGTSVILPIQPRG